MLCPRIVRENGHGELVYCPGNMIVLDGVAGHGVHIRILKCDVCGLRGTENSVFTDGKVLRAFRRLKAATMAVWRSERKKQIDKANVTADRYKHPPAS